MNGLLRQRKHSGTCAEALYILPDVIEILPDIALIHHSLIFLMMGAAKALKGKETASLDEAALALEAGMNLIMEKAGSKRGEKTILDSLGPGIDALKAGSGLPAAERLASAAKAAAEGSESTRQMRSVHGRAAYYGDKSIGVLDGGSAVGRLIFEGIADARL